MLIFSVLPVIVCSEDNKHSSQIIFQKIQEDKELDLTQKIEDIKLHQSSRLITNPLTSPKKYSAWKYENKRKNSEKRQKGMRLFLEKVKTVFGSSNQEDHYLATSFNGEIYFIGFLKEGNENNEIFIIRKEESTFFFRKLYSGRENTLYLGTDFIVYDSKSSKNFNILPLIISARNILQSKNSNLRLYETLKNGKINISEIFVKSKIITVYKSKKRKSKSKSCKTTDKEQKDNGVEELDEQNKNEPKSGDENGSEDEQNKNESKSGDDNGSEDQEETDKTNKKERKTYYNLIYHQEEMVQMQQDLPILSENWAIYFKSII